MSEVRKLAAILVADVVGYSRLAGAATFSDTAAFTQQITRIAEGLRKAGLPES